MAGYWNILSAVTVTEIAENRNPYAMIFAGGDVLNVIYVYFPAKITVSLVC